MALPKTFFTLIADEHDPAFLDEAVDLATKHGAHLSVAVIGIAPPPPVDIYNAVPLDWWTKEREEGMALLREKGEAVREKLAGGDLSSDVAFHYVDEAMIATVVGNHGRYCDMSVAMAPELRKGLVWSRAQTALLFESARPVLFPAEGRPAVADAERIVIAWNSSREAARAVFSAIDLLKRASMVHVVMVEPEARENRQGEEPGSEIGAYLARHGIRVTVDRLPDEGRSIGAIIMRHANDVDADLVVAGAYGHSRLREFLLGGTTVDLMDKADRTMLLAH